MPVISNQRVSTLPPGLELSAGRLDNASLVGSSGLNSTIGATLETICSQGGIRNILSAAEQLKIASSSTDDTNSGSGHARRVRIKGLDSDGLEIEEDVNLNGTGQVTTVASFLHINDFRVQKTGTGGDVNAGTITAYANDGTTVLYEIAAGENQQQSATYTMPANKGGYLTSFVASATGSAQVSIWVQPAPGVTPFFQKLTTIVSGNGATTYNLPNPFSVPKSGIMEFRAKSLTGGNVAVGADFQIILEE